MLSGTTWNTITNTKNETLDPMLLCRLIHCPTVYSSAHAKEVNIVLKAVELLLKPTTVVKTKVQLDSDDILG